MCGLPKNDQFFSRNYMLGHEFLGWSTEQSSSFPEYAPSTVFSKNKNTKLYAVWEHPFEQTSYTAPTCTKSGEQISVDV